MTETLSGYLQAIKVQCAGGVPCPPSPPINQTLPNTGRTLQPYSELRQSRLPTAPPGAASLPDTHRGGQGPCPCVLRFVSYLQDAPRRSAAPAHPRDAAARRCLHRRRSRSRSRPGPHSGDVTAAPPARGCGACPAQPAGPGARRRVPLQRWAWAACLPGAGLAPCQGDCSPCRAKRSLPMCVALPLKVSCYSAAPSPDKAQRTQTQNC